MRTPNQALHLSGGACRLSVTCSPPMPRRQVSLSFGEGGFPVAKKSVEKAAPEAGKKPTALAKRGRDKIAPTFK